MKTLLYIIVGAGLIASSGARQVQVTVEGRAVAANATRAREIALADALRQAVRQGIGTNVVAITGTRDFTADYDLVFTRALGFVREYQILSQGPGKDGIYRVKIKATVTDTDRFSSQQEILKLLVRQKGSPRVAIQTRIQGNPASNATNVLRELALAYQLQLVDPDIVAAAEIRRARREHLAGDEPLAHARKSGLSSPCDFRVQATITISPASPVDVYGVKLNAFNIAAEFSAVWSDTGEIVAAFTPPAATVTTTLDGAAGANDCLARYLQGRVPDTQNASAKDLFRRIIVHWMTELDLGRKIQVECKAISRSEFDILIDALKNQAGIGQVYPREFDARLFSRIDVESRLKSDQLVEILETRLQQHHLERCTAGYILMTPKNSTADSWIQRISPFQQASKNRIRPSPWRWPLITGGIIAVAGGCLLLRNPKKVRSTTR